MSSPLDGRIRAIARAEVEALLDSIKSPSAEMAGAGAPVSASLANGLTPTQEMQQQITDLHEHLHLAATNITRLEERVGALEKAAGQMEQEERPTAKRAPRKASGTAPTPE